MNEAQQHQIADGAAPACSLLVFPAVWAKRRPPPISSARRPPCPSPPTRSPRTSATLSRSPAATAHWSDHPLRGIRGFQVLGRKILRSREEPPLPCNPMPGCGLILRARCLPVPVFHLLFYCSRFPCALLLHVPLLAHARAHRTLAETRCARAASTAEPARLRRPDEGPPRR